MAPANFVITLLSLLFGYVGEWFFFYYLFLNEDHLFWLEIYIIHITYGVDCGVGF